MAFTTSALSKALSLTPNTEYANITKDADTGREEKKAEIRGRILIDEFENASEQEPPSSQDSFDLHEDDSSDDEASEKIKDYKIEEEWGSYKEKNVNPTHDHLLSFVAHAASIKLLHLPEINEHYYSRFKPQYMRGDATAQLQKLTKLAMVRAIKETVINCAKKFLQSPDEKETPVKEEAIEKLSKQIDENQGLQACINKNIHAVIGNLETTIRSADIHDSKNVATTIKHNFSPLTEAPGSSLFGEISSLFLEIIHQHNFSFRPPEKGIENTKTSPTDLSFFKTAMFSLATGTLEEFNVPIDVKNTSGKTGSLTALRDNHEGQNKYPTLFSTVRKILSREGAQGYPRNKLIANKSQIVTALTTDLVRLDGLGRNEAWQFATNSNERPHLSPLIGLLTITDARLLSEFQRQLGTQFSKQMDSCIKGYCRKTLDDTHVFINTDPLDFFANFRLSTRSQQRQMKNLRGRDWKEGFLSERAITSVTRIWQFNSHKHFQASETQRILSSSFARKDKVETMGSYGKVLASINYFKKNLLTLSGETLKVSDKDIAQSIRQVFIGTFNVEASFPGLLPEDSKFVTRLLAGLTYIFLGCEASRNPGMLVINQMLLDLVIAGTKWDAALRNEELTPGLMPMAPKGAINVSRHLNKHYRDYMPRPYLYDGDSNGDEKSDNKAIMRTKEELLKLEADIIWKWLKLKFKDVEKSTHTNFKVAGVNRNSSEFAGLLLSHIEASYAEWFGSSLAALAEKHKKLGAKASSLIPPLAPHSQSFSIQENNEPTRFISYLMNHQKLLAILFMKRAEAIKDIRDEKSFYQVPNTCFMNNLQRRVIFIYEIWKNEFPIIINEDKDGNHLFDFDTKGLVLLPEIATSQDGYLNQLELVLRKYSELIKDNIRPLYVCVNTPGHFTTLCIDAAPEAISYRYIDSLHDYNKNEKGIEKEEKGDRELKNRFATIIRKVFNKYGLKEIFTSYNKQQHYHYNNIRTHNDECGMHNVFNTLFMLINSPSADIAKMRSSDLKIPGDNPSKNGSLDPEDGLILADIYRELFKCLLDQLLEDKKLNISTPKNSASVTVSSNHASLWATTKNRPLARTDSIYTAPDDELLLGRYFADTLKIF